MKERLAEILALLSVADALHQEDMVNVLSELTILSDEYLPVLQFLMAPDNCKTRTLCFFLLSHTLSMRANLFVLSIQ